MKYSYELVSEYIDGRIEKKEMIDFLDMLGLNPVVVSEEEGDIIWDLETPANRGYLLSLLGVAQEILPFTDSKIKLPEDKFAEDIGSEIAVKIENEKDCFYYSCRIMQDVHNSASPEYMKRALRRMGYRTSFNTVDISNFVMAEIGQPLHIFDLDKIEGHVEIRRGRKGESSVLIDGKKREFDEDILVIADEKKVIAVAGIMGCQISEVRENTRNVLIESAVFNPVVVRRSSKKLGLATEASLRFERGIDIDTASKGMARTAYLIQKLCNGRAGKLVESGKKNERKREIELEIGKAERILGIDIKESVISNILTKLGFAANKKGKNTYIIEPPFYRNDIREDVDIIEEIARYGKYSEIPSMIPVATIKPTPSINEVRKTEKIKDIAVKLGFSEFINMGLTDKKNAEIKKSSPHVPLENPLSINLGFLRSSLVPEMLESIRYNINHGTTKIDAFETGKVFCMKNGSVCEETNMLFAVANNGNFFDLKGKIERFLKECGLKKIRFADMPFNFSEDGNNASIYLEDNGRNEIGNIFILSDRVKTTYDIETEEICLCELYIEKFLNHVNFDRQFSDLPKFPSSSRDFSFVFQGNVSWNEIENTILSLNLPIEKISFFDSYEGENIERGKISISFSVIFRYADRTLENAEISEFSVKITEAVNSRLKGRLRGENTNC
ncbi:MAG TPA: phenylalanine--tRNA ligase subunit beta [bacterium]|nr:phenylalanine--tRNA ligase subunit beta [bacterium]